MIFEYVELGVDVYELGVMAYNLGLTYFLWDVAKFIVTIMANKLKRGKF